MVNARSFALGISQAPGCALSKNRAHEKGNRRTIGAPAPALAIVIFGLVAQAKNPYLVAATPVINPASAAEEPAAAHAVADVYTAINDVCATTSDAHTSADAGAGVVATAAVDASTATPTTTTTTTTTAVALNLFHRRHIRRCVQEG